MDGDADVPFKWLSSESLALDVVEELRSSGVDVDPATFGPPGPEDLPDDDDAAFEPLLLIAGAAAIAHLAKTLSRIVRDHRHGGVVVDARTEPLTIREGVRGVDSGTIVVVNTEGPQVFNRPEENALRDAISRR